MGAILARLTHKIVMQLHLVADICTICSSHSGWQVQKVLDTSSYMDSELHYGICVFSYLLGILIC